MLNLTFQNNQSTAMMISIQGYFDGEKVILQEKIPVTKRQHVIITFVEEKSPSEEAMEQLMSEVQMTSLQGGAFDFLADEPDLYDDYITREQP
jgi:hypothetical protein